MLSTPCKYCTLSTHFINSLLLTVDPKDIDDFLSDETKEINRLLVCPDCGLIPHQEILPENKKCICGEKKFSKQEIELIENQSQSSFYYTQDNPLSNSLNNSKKPVVLLIICMDNSGSMVSTYRTPPSSIVTEFFREKNQKRKTKADFEMDEFNPENPEKNNYISRKDLLLMYLKQHLRNLMDKNNDIEYQIYAILFSNTVMLFGNGTAEKPLILSPEVFDKIKDNPSDCMKFGRKNGSSVFSPQEKPDLDVLFSKLEAEKPKGSTSLAPAIAIGLGFLKSLEKEPDSCHFMIFTDGRTNTGFGNTENASETQKKQETCMEEYEKLGDIGFDWGVVFHLFAFEEETGIRYLSKLTEKTKFGQLSRLKVKTDQNDNFYDEEQFLTGLKAAFRIPKELNFTNVELKLFFDQRIKMNPCKNSEVYTDTCEVGDNKFIVKNIGSIYNLPEKAGFLYKVPSAMKPGEYIQIQSQISFTNIKNKKRNYVIVFNEKIKVKEECKTSFKIEFGVLTKIMILNDFQVDSKKVGMFLDFIQNHGDMDNFNMVKSLLQSFEVSRALLEKNEEKIKKLIRDKQQKKKEAERKKFDIGGASNDQNKNERKNHPEEKKQSSTMNNDDSDEDSITLTIIELRRKMQEDENKIFQRIQKK